VALNNSCRTITGCLKNTPVEKVYLLAGVAPPNLRRLVITNLEKCKETNDKRHLMFGLDMPIFRLKSRKSFLKTSEIKKNNPLERSNHRHKLRIGASRTATTRPSVRMVDMENPQQNESRCGQIKRQHV